MKVQKVYESASKVVGEIRKTGKPQMLFLNTYRFAPHSKGDDFRDMDEVAEYRKLDPLQSARNWVRMYVGRLSPG